MHYVANDQVLGGDDLLLAIASADHLLRLQVHDFATFGLYVVLKDVIHVEHDDHVEPKVFLSCFAQEDNEKVAEHDDPCGPDVVFSCFGRVLIVAKRDDRAYIKQSYEDGGHNSVEPKRRKIKVKQKHPYPFGLPNGGELVGTDFSQ